MMCKQTVCMGGSISGVSVVHGKAMSYERRRRDVVAGVRGFSPGKYSKQNDGIWMCLWHY